MQVRVGTEVNYTHNKTGEAYLRGVCWRCLAGKRPGDSDPSRPGLCTAAITGRHGAQPIMMASRASRRGLPSLPGPLPVSAIV